MRHFATYKKNGFNHSKSGILGGLLCFPLSLQRKKMAFLVLLSGYFSTKKNATNIATL